MRALIRELFETVILALMIFLALQFSVRNYQIEGSSMDPTLKAGEYVLVNKLVYLRVDPRDIARLVPFWDVTDDEHLFPFRPPRRGDVIIFRFPKDQTREFVKRVVGLPGETVEIRQGQVFIDDVALDEPYIIQPDRTTMEPQAVGRNSYFVLGDNRRASNDSRDWGPVPDQNVVGRAWVSFWPLNRWHALSLPLMP